MQTESIFSFMKRSGLEMNVKVCPGEFTVDEKGLHNKINHTYICNLRERTLLAPVKYRENSDSLLSLVFGTGATPEQAISKLVEKLNGYDVLIVDPESVHNIYKEVLLPSNLVVE